MAVRHGMNGGSSLEQLRRTGPHPLLPVSIRPLAGALVGFCVALTVLLGASFAGHTRAGWFDSSVDARLQGLIGSRPIVFDLVSLGGQVAVTI